MSTQAAISAALLCVGTFVGGTLLMSRSKLDPAPVVEAPTPAPERATPEPTPTPAKPPEPTSPGISISVAADGGGSQWKVPPLMVNGRAEPFATSPVSVAVNDTGDRVMVQAEGMVDVWEHGKAAPLRVRPKRIYGAWVSPDASRMYFLNEDTKKLETCDATGKQIGAWAPPNPSRVPTWGRFMHAGFNPATNQMTIGIGLDKGRGLYTISPQTGQGALAVPLSRDEETSCSDIFPRADGRYFVFFSFHSDGTRPKGIYALTSAGAVQGQPPIPSPPETPAAHPHPAVSEDGRFAALKIDRGVKVWDTRDGKCVLHWKKEYYFAAGCRLNNGRLLIATHSDYYESGVGFGGTIMRTLPSMFLLFDTTSGKSLGGFRPQDSGSPMDKFALSPNGRFLALADEKRVAVVEIGSVFK